VVLHRCVGDIVEDKLLTNCNTDCIFGSQLKEAEVSLLKGTESFSFKCVDIALNGLEVIGIG
jgi:hypothetical protein